MYTLDDKLFCVLHSCDESLHSSRLTCYMYLYELIKCDFAFKYTISNGGIKSRAVDEYTGKLIALGLLQNKNGILKLTSNGDIRYSEFLMFADEWEVFYTIKRSVDALSDNELTFVVLVDILVMDVLNKYGADGLRSKEDFIRGTLTKLSSEYSETNFDNAIGLLSRIRGLAKHE